ncbi:hypothetical protein H4582DRAFT_1529995 [Lactarius indigo]|nr:hypothetical protein H4582DRAFT_1529995 [Lactarius indigo]
MFFSSFSFSFSRPSLTSAGYRTVASSPSQRSPLTTLTPRDMPSRCCYHPCHRLVAFGPTQMTSRSRSCNDFAAPSTHHPHPLPLDPATSTWLRHPRPDRPGYNHHLGPAMLPPPRHSRHCQLDPHRRRLDTAPTATSTPLRHYHRRRTPRPTPASSRHSPHRHLDASAAHPFTPPQPHPIGAVLTPPINLPPSSFMRDPQTDSSHPCSTCSSVYMINKFNVYVCTQVCTCTDMSRYDLKTRSGFCTHVTH